MEKEGDSGVLNYSTKVPSAREAGTYYVWYKVVGDDNHSDVAAAYVTVEIVVPSVQGGTVTAKAGALLVCATYENGRMTDVKTVTLTADCFDKAASELLNVPTSGHYKLFLLGNAYVPLCEAFDSKA